MTDVQTIWDHLVKGPLPHIVLTLIAYQIGSLVYEKSGRNSACNPVLLAIAIVIAVLTLTNTTYPAYFDGAKFIHFLLGPATVALAIPLYRQIDTLKRSARAILVSLFVGSVTAAASAVTIAWILGADRKTLVTISPKSVTAPVAMAIVEQLGGIEALTAVLVILTGIFGAIAGPVLMNRMKIDDWEARGFALGIASHGIGTARALQVNKTAGAFAALAMALNAILTSVFLPIAWSLIV